MKNTNNNIEILYKSIEGIINNNYSSLAVYLLCSEQEEYELYKLSLSDNFIFKNIILKCVGKADESCEFYDYTNDIKPNGITSILYLKNSEIPNYADLKNGIIKDNSNPINEEKLLEIFNNIKGYAIKITYIDDTIKKELIAYSKLFTNHLYTPQKKFFKFQENKQLMEKVDFTMLQFNDSLLSIDIEDTMFVLSRYYFEQLFKYEELIEQTSSHTIDTIKNTNLIKNFDIFEEYCGNNKNLKRKLSNMVNSPSVNNTTFEKFKSLKNTYGDNLFYEIDEINNSITVDESRLAKSATHIIRIFNDEAAITIITETPIFANEKILIQSQS